MIVRGTAARQPPKAACAAHKPFSIAASPQARRGDARRVFRRASGGIAPAANWTIANALG